MKLLVTSFLLPPGIMVLMLLLGLYLIYKRRPAGFILFLTLVVGWTLSTPAFGRFASTMLISQISGPALVDTKGTDLIIVLTGGMDYAGEIGWLPKMESHRRASVAYELQAQIGSRVPILFSGGKTEGLRNPSEAEVIRAQFDRNRAQLTPTILEESSTNTYESALQCAAIVQQRLAKKVFLVTSEVHMLRALAVFRGRGMDPIPFPVLSIPRGPLKLKDFMPTAQGVELTSKALYEMYGIIEYILGGKASVEGVFYHRNI
jgi:uncharacterized SAM-binding protein YcdF (DUF218 family)